MKDTHGVSKQHEVLPISNAHGATFNLVEAALSIRMLCKQACREWKFCSSQSPNSKSHLQSRSPVTTSNKITHFPTSAKTIKKRDKPRAILILWKTPFRPSSHKRSQHKPCLSSESAVLNLRQSRRLLLSRARCA